MRADCHMHMLLDGEDWKQAICRHSVAPDEGYIREKLEIYRRLGYTYLRDGGDRWGAGAAARSLARTSVSGVRSRATWASSTICSGKLSTR